MAIALALAAAASWGTSDFFAGLASRRLPVPLVLALMEGGGLVVILAYALATGAPFFHDASGALSAVAAGLSGVIGLGCFFRALAIGTMSVVAPISSAGVALPVIVGLATGERPSAVAAAGLAVIVAGVILVSREAHDDEHAARAGRASIMLALLGAIGFGGFFVFTAPAAEQSVPWTLVLVRAAPLPFVLALVWRMRLRRPPRELALRVAALGTLDLAATALIALASNRGELSVVSVLGAMYPVATVVLAAVVLRERMRPPQWAGIALALGGVAMVAAG